MTETTERTAGTQHSRETSKLDRRRAKAQEAKAAVDATQGKLAALDERLASNAARAEEHEAALRTALEEAGRRRKALKAAKKERDDLRTARKKAQAATAKARRRAYAADDKYDRVVLEEMVRRERDRDLDRAGQPNTDKPTTKVDRSSAPERSDDGSDAPATSQA